MAKLLTVVLSGALAVSAAGCSSNEANSNVSKTTTNTTTTTSAAPSPAPHGGGSTTASGTAATTTGEDIPAIVRAALPDAQSFTKQHKDLTPAQVSSIEKATSNKISDTDHHSYLAFSTANGARRQVGAATIVEANGKQMVVVYESRNGLPYIREVRAEGVPQAFLDQFKGKGHDDKLQFGQNVKAQGAEDATARAATAAIYGDVLAMQALYGAAHSH